MRNIFVLSMILISFIIIPIVVILFQVYLVKIGKKYLGLILPIITFTLSLMVVISIIIFGTATREYSETKHDENGVISTYVYRSNAGDTDTFPIVVSGIIVFIIINIPTGIFLLIYKIVGKNNQDQIELNKMSIQDL